MPLHPVLADQLQLALQPAEASARTRRDARLPAIAGKVEKVLSSDLADLKRSIG